ncbi:glycosyltransferase [Algoriphagus pacificus]|uniref:Glycosyltransferase n=1 Tax=Algoriphagus pacificus TaxID=2811234 RepID=A0ABS3CJG4_9BACT|nr:glycosyltransferase [Algoriphagus pacificus]MBN7816355.1 glycosyltransferase [Algoriphagus pacificus]
MISILQPHVPHYREEFFAGIGRFNRINIYCYNLKEAKSENFFPSNLKVKKIRNIQFGPFLFYNPFSLFRNKDETLVLMLHFGHLSTWFLLFSKFFHKKKIILMGQGISVKRYLQETNKPDFKLKLMISLADGAWIYTKKEANQWQKIFPRKSIIALSNTISGVESILEFTHVQTKENLKKQYRIGQSTCFIFCARFTNNYRRIDLMIELIEKLDSKKFGFIIIGDGKLKPDFSSYSNVYDFGSVYDQSLKDDLFTVADFYLQPGWIGLSIVEALAYGKPVLTFKRSEHTLQCVEYYYLKHKINGLIFENIQDALCQIENLDDYFQNQMSINAREYVRKNLLMKNMIDQANSII